MFCASCGTWAPDDAARCPLCGAAFRSDGQPLTVLGLMRGAAPGVTPIASYGGFWRRFAAVVLDSLVLWFPSATVRVLLGLDPLAVFDPQSSVAWLAACIEFTVGGTYAALMIRSPAQGTLGLQVLGLQVTDLEGRRISFARATWRYVAQLLTLLTFGVGYLLQLVTPRRQTLHDLLSATVVVRARALPATPDVHAMGLTS